MNDPTTADTDTARLTADCVDPAPCGHAVCEGLRDHVVMVQRATGLRNLFVDDVHIGGATRHQRRPDGPVTWSGRIPNGAEIAPDCATQADALDAVLARHFNPAPPVAAAEAQPTGF
jgi:hypothetical protein